MNRLPWTGGTARPERPPAVGPLDVASPAPAPGRGAPSEGWADVHPAASANAAPSPAGAAPAPPAPPRPAAAARIRLGTVLRVELTEGRRRVAHLPLFLLELFCMILPYLLLGGLLFVLIQWVLSRSAEGFAWLGDGLLSLFGNGCVSSLFLLILIGVAFMFIVGAGRGSYDQQLGRTLFGIVRGAFVLAFRVVFRTCRAVSEALRHSFTSGRFMDRGQRTIQVRNIDVWESPQSQFTFQIRGELIQGGIAEGNTLEVEGVEDAGRFIVRRVRNRTTQTEVRWTNRPI